MSETNPETQVENDAIRAALSTPAFIEETRKGAAHLLSHEVDTTEIQDLEGGQ
jgi:hypothetical protein